MKIDGLDIVWGGSRISVLFIAIIIFLIGIIIGTFITVFGEKKYDEKNGDKRNVKNAVGCLLFIFGIPILLFLFLGIKEFVSDGVESEKLVAYQSGYETGTKDGYNEGYKDGESKGNDESYKDGYNAGYIDGYEDGILDVNIEDYSGGRGSNTESSITVYITDYGSKYHRWGCQYLWDSANPISLSSALSNGYAACSKCW